MLVKAERVAPNALSAYIYIISPASRFSCGLAFYEFRIVSLKAHESVSYSSMCSWGLCNVSDQLDECAVTLGMAVGREASLSAHWAFVY